MFEISTLTELGLAPAPAPPSQSPGRLQQEAFLELMIAQFRNQDPFSPMENGEFLGQLAQFGTVSGIEDLQKSLGTLANSLYSDQALQASGLIDREVLVARDVGPLRSDRALRGAVELPLSTGSLEVRVIDANGELVRRLDLGLQERGLVRFAWDGRDESGQQMPVGNYHLEAFAGQAGVREQVPVLVESRVESVTLGNSGGVLLNLEGLGELALGEVRRIGSSSQED